MILWELIHQVLFHNSDHNDLQIYQTSIGNYSATEFEKGDTFNGYIFSNGFIDQYVDKTDMAPFTSFGATVHHIWTMDILSIWAKMYPIGNCFYTIYYVKSSTKCTTFSCINY